MCLCHPHLTTLWQRPCTLRNIFDTVSSCRSNLATLCLCACSSSSVPESAAPSSRCRERYCEHCVRGTSASSLCAHLTAILTVVQPPRPVERAFRDKLQLSLLRVFWTQLQRVLQWHYCTNLPNRKYAKHSAVRHEKICTGIHIRHVSPLDIFRHQGCHYSCPVLRPAVTQHGVSLAALLRCSGQL